MIFAGVDEVGRGALFGPVVAGAVILPDRVLDELVASGVKDSKQLTAKRRLLLAAQIRDAAIDCQVGMASVREIDRLNILQASLLAMRRAILRLEPIPELVLIDGNQRVRDLPMSQETIVKGDSLSVAIAAASIVAKVWRDELMARLAVKYPEYDLTNNKGYGSKKHRQALLDCGPSRQHRLSFAPCKVEPQPLQFQLPFDS